MNARAKIEFGDFQTPSDLADGVCKVLARQMVKADFVIEPTCGQGSFLVAAGRAFPSAELLGWDINQGYVKEAQAQVKHAGLTTRTQIQQQDFFAKDWAAEFSSLQGGVLVIGNLPWVTNAGVSAIRGTNVPTKNNFLGLRGLDARTGKSNFDISEWMLIHLVKALRGRKAVIAMLCKTSTARKLLRYAWQNDGQIASASLHHIDAKLFFNAAVDACLLFARTGGSGPCEAKLYDNLASEFSSQTIGLAGSDLVADITAYRRHKQFEGLCPYQWRSGVKHDCSAIMELLPKGNGLWENKLEEQIKLEPDYVFPLLKCSDLANGRSTPHRHVIVPQKRVGEDTRIIAHHAPLTWKYLVSHRKLFEARKSSIHNGKFPFSLFGVGPYTFAPWKVAVSGLHKVTRFMLVGPHDHQPVLFDDTCYFLPFNHEHEARIVQAILGSPSCEKFLAALVFPDSKRPITVDLLQRLNFQALAIEAGLDHEWAAARSEKSRYPEEMQIPQVEFVME